MTTERFTNATVEWGGIKLRGNVQTIDRGAPKKTFYANADESVDFSVERMMAKVEVEVSYVTDVELSAIEALKDEPMVITASSGRKLSFPSMTHESTGTISKEGAVTVTASGKRTKDG